MRKSVILLVLGAVLITGCDFVRTLAGRPTAAQVEDLHRQQLAAEEARHQAVLDSLEQVKRHMEDSLAALEQHLLDSLSQARGTLLNPAKMGGLYTTKLDSKYYIVVGAFRNRAYAERKLKQCNQAGYTATIVSFRNGLLAVAIYPSDNLDRTLKTLRQIRGNEICPQEGWILINE